MLKKLGKALDKIPDLIPIDTDQDNLPLEFGPKPNISDFSYLDDLPGYDESDKELIEPEDVVDTSRDQFRTALAPSKVVKLQPLEKEILRKKIFRALNVKGADLGEGVADELATSIIDNIDKYKFTPQQVKDLIIKITKHLYKKERRFVDSNPLKESSDYFTGLLFHMNPRKFLYPLRPEEKIDMLKKIELFSREISQG